jgi:hypothetical protein
MKILLVIACVCTALATSHAQVPDSKGKDFWFTFIPNFHNNLDDLPNDPSLQLEHQIYIYIGSETPASGTITLRDETGTERIVPFSITDPSKLFEFNTFFLPYELRGFNNHGSIDYSGMQTEEPAEQSIHIVSDADVTVYALNQGQLTSDAFLVLPSDAIGTDYSIISYTSDIQLDGPFGEPGGASTPSQFAVVATEDNTVIEILPTSPTFKAPNGERNSVVLDRGQSYLVQVDPRTIARSDLTGTLVRASRPVAVFAGHQRATIPIEFKGTLGSRDCIVEQMNPITTWGKSAFVTPLALSSDEFNQGSSLYRVVAAFDSTDVFIDDVLLTTLSAQTFYEAPLTRALEIRTSKPAGVGVYKKTAGPAAQGLVRVGDPFLMLIPPAEQFMDSYRFVNIQASQWGLINDIPTPLTTVYLEQYLNIVIPTVSAGSVILDGSNVPSGNFQRIGSSPYSWAQLSMTDGVHTITADTTFGIYVYGYGKAVSYGYIGGMAFRPLDVYPPKITGKAICGVYDGAVTDSILGDTRVASATPVPGTDLNVTFTLGAFTPPQSVVPFSVALINPYLDGYVDVEAFDNVRQQTITTVSVPGFTVGPVGEGADTLPVIRDRVIPLRQFRCDTVTLENYGSFRRTITSLRTTSGATITEPSAPFDIEPGQFIDVVLCRQYDVEGLAVDTLIIGDTCIDRPVMVIRYEVRNDDEAPSITENADACSTAVIVDIADDRDFDFGLMTVQVLEPVLRNCTVEMVTQSVPRNTFKVTVIDPFADAIYGFLAIDSAGNTSQSIDTLPGFTLEINGDRSAWSASTAPETPVGSVTCDTIWLSNYGSRPQVVRDIFIRWNTRFSMPGSQFSIVIPPGEQRPLIYCYEPVRSTEEADLDTLEFIYGCNVKRHALSGTGSEVVYSGLSRCNVPVEVIVSRLSSPITLMPSPADDHVTIVLETPTDHAAVRLVSLQGETVLDLSWSGDATNSLLLDVTTIAAGMYGVVVDHDHGTATSVLVVR